MFAEKLNLTGKTAVITGSSQGIGEAIALTFAEFGATIVLHYNSGKQKAEQVKKKINKLKTEVHIVQADFSKPNGVKSFYKKVLNNVPQVDILVINASVQIAKDWDKLTSDEFDEQIQANFKSTLFLMQSFAPAMEKQKWGRILTIGSVQQVKPHPEMIAYAATKSAVLNLVRNIAMQLADKGITVNNLAPGIIATPRINEPVPKADDRILQRMQTPVGEIGQPEDCAGMALFICSEAGKFITGQNIFVDGGMSL